MKKLLITSTDLMMIQFLVPHVKHLSANGFSVEIACSEVGGRMGEVRQALEGTVDAIHMVRLDRSPASFRNLSGFRDMNRILSENHYDIIWTNEPVMGVVTRLAARQSRKAGTKVVYMCHGFHFYKGAPVTNWVLFYPIERIMARWCDMIVTINREDEARARTFACPRVEYIHGIGVDTQRLQARSGQSDIRTELGLKQEDFLLLSVGELNENKNHQVILRALAQLKDPAIHYIICGKGHLRPKLEQLAARLGQTDRVHFLGYRRDVVNICAQADLFVHPSRREGLSVASLEAMYCGMPLIVSRVRGSGDYLQDGYTGFLVDPENVDGFAEAIRKMKNENDFRTRAGAYNRNAVEPFLLDHVKQEVYGLLMEI